MQLIRIKKQKADISQSYRNNFLISMIVVITVLIAIFRIPLDFDTELKIEEREQQIIQLEDIIQTQQFNTPPPPQRPRTPEVVPDEVIVEDQFFNFDLDVGNDGALPPPPPPPDNDEEEQEEPEFFVAVEQMPYIIGGESTLYDALVYPELARRAGVEGRVVVQFIVDENGNVINPQVIRGVGAGLDEAAVRAIQSVQFEPGRQRGRPVPVQYAIPVNFRLDRS